MSNGWFSFGKDSPAVKLARIEFDNGYALNIMSDQLPFTIGRAKDRNLVVTSAFVSRRHCTIDAVDGELHIIDDHLLKHESAAIAHRIHLLFGGEFMLAISPHDANGQLIDAPEPDDTASATRANTHGVLLVDLCDSTEKTPEQVGTITQHLRIELLRKHRDKLLMIKNTWDGFLLVYENPGSAFESAERVLRFQNAKGAQFDFDLRVTLDAGATTETADRDRLGIAINRAARIEKVQAGNIEERGEQFESLRARNRCILSEDMKRTLTLTNRATCQHIGACQLKGFGDVAHQVFQYPFDQNERGPGSGRSPGHLDRRSVS